MSVHAISWVLANSEARLGNRLVLLALADHAKADGSCAWPSQDMIAHEARLSVRQVRRCLLELERDGAIVSRGVSRFGTTIYDLQLTPQNGEDNLSARTDCPRTNRVENRSDLSDEPSGTVSREGARAGERVKIGGKSVNPTSWSLTEEILTEFNSQAGRKLRLLTSAGEASNAAKRIYGRVRAYPDITLDEHADIIRRTLASQWWGLGTPSIGVVYGPGVFEENITRPATDGVTSLDARRRTGGAQSATAEKGAEILRQALHGSAAV